METHTHTQHTVRLYEYFMLQFVSYVHSYLFIYFFTYLFTYLFISLFQLRTRLEEELDMNLTDYKHFIDEEMIIIMRQMDSPSQIFDYLYLGSEWNASNLEELRNNGFVLSPRIVNNLFIYLL